MNKAAVILKNIYFIPLIIPIYVGSLKGLGYNHMGEDSMRKLIVLTLTAFLFFSFLLVSCGSGQNEAAYAKAAPLMVAEQSGAAMMDLAKEALPSRSASPTTAVERKLVSTAGMEIEVEDLEAAEKSLQEGVEKIGGYIQSSSRYGDSFSMTIKVPAERFDSFLDETGALGQVRSKNINVEDVSDRYYDLEHRIKNLEILVERYQSYLEEAKNVEELLTVERQLNETITELERLKGSYKNLGHLVSFATLHVSVYLPSWESEEDPLPSLRAGLRNFGRMVVRVLYGIFFIILGIIAFGIPVVLVIGLFYLLAFGRIGLVRRFFGRLRPGRKESKASKGVKD